jgi:hypothetical protein
MRPATYYFLAQVWASQPHHAQPGARSRATRRGRHAMAPRRYHFGRELPALARRVRAAMSGTSQPA